MRGLISIKTSDFYFDLPEALIAQTPLKKRDASRMLLLDKNTGAVEHKHFYDLTSYLKKGDCLVLNNSRVLPARLLGIRTPSGGHCEVVLLSDKGDKIWECIVKPGRKMREGATLSFGDGKLTATVETVLENGNRMIRFHYEGIFLEVLEDLGKMPLPPYIKAELEDKERYQTVYSKEVGSAAAPTAGLHFTPEMMEKLQDMGVDICYVTLHVGLGTFRPVKVDNPLEHDMHKEYCEVPEETALMVNRAKMRGSRVICVGTTSCRTVESFATEDGYLEDGGKWTNIFIYPPYKFKILDALVTNFHLPESTLLMLISALAGKDNVLKAYEEAIREEYRFFSFGDAMFIS